MEAVKKQGQEETRLDKGYQKNSVYQSNEIIESSYDMTPREKRLLLCAISQLDSRRPLAPGTRITVTAAQFAATFPTVDIDNSYSIIKKAAERLFNREIQLKDRDRKHGGAFRWIEAYEYKEGEGKVEITFTTSIAPYLTMLHRQFTKFRIQQVAELRSIHSYRLFEMLMQWRGANQELNISVEDFRNRLQLTNEYTKFYDFKTKVIQRAVNELQQKAGLVIEWHPVRRGRSVKSLVFKYQDSEQMGLFEDEDRFGPVPVPGEE